MEVASVFDQNHKDNHKNSMAGTTIVIDLKRGDEVVVYAYTGEKTRTKLFKSASQKKEEGENIDQRMPGASGEFCL